MPIWNVFYNWWKKSLLPGWSTHAGGKTTAHGSGSPPGLPCALRIMRVQGISHEELSNRLQLTPDQVRNILKGKENLTLDMITSLEQALETSLIEIPAYG
jgi:antitoxin component HigA of HigAB toxin-antitoxin module